MHDYPAPALYLNTGDHPHSPSLMANTHVGGVHSAETDQLLREKAMELLGARRPMQVIPVLREKPDHQPPAHLSGTPSTPCPSPHRAPQTPRRYPEPKVLSSQTSSPHRTPRERTTPRAFTTPADYSQSINLSTTLSDASSPGVYGLGMKISDRPPHFVQHVDELMDENDCTASPLADWTACNVYLVTCITARQLSHVHCAGVLVGKVMVGDMVLSIDGTPVDHMDIGQMKEIIFGPFGSLLRIS
eukprot:400148-Rhodomonas_salina.3